MAFKTFHQKTKDYPLDAFDLLTHYVSILDKALIEAFDLGDMDRVESLADKMLDASDRLTSIVLNLQGEEEPTNGEPTEPKIKLGFQPTEDSGISTPDNESG